MLLLQIISRMFHPWQRLPTELKLEVWQHALSQPDLITHSRHLDNLQIWLLSPIIGARNKELAQLAIDACKFIVRDSHSQESRADYPQTTSTTHFSSLRTPCTPPLGLALDSFDQSRSMLGRFSIWCSGLPHASLTYRPSSVSSSTHTMTPPISSTARCTHGPSFSTSLPTTPSQVILFQQERIGSMTSPP